MSKPLIDTRLQSASAALGEIDNIQVRGKFTAPWPWLVLIPLGSGCVEVFDLPETDQIKLANLTVALARTLKSETRCDKINIASLGNVVPQLHVHIVARNVGDIGWPGPMFNIDAPRLSEIDAERRLIELQRVVDCCRS